MEEEAPSTTDVSAAGAVPIQTATTPAPKDSVNWKHPHLVRVLIDTVKAKKVRIYSTPLNANFNQYSFIVQFYMRSFLQAHLATKDVMLTWDAVRNHIADHKAFENYQVPKAAGIRSKYEAVYSKSVLDQALEKEGANLSSLPSEVSSPHWYYIHNVIKGMWQEVTAWKEKLATDKLKVKNTAAAMVYSENHFLDANEPPPQGSTAIDPFADQPGDNFGSVRIQSNGQVVYDPDNNASSSSSSASAVPATTSAIGMATPATFAKATAGSSSGGSSGGSFSSSKSGVKRSFAVSAAQDFTDLSEMTSAIKRRVDGQHAVDMLKAQTDAKRVALEEQRLAQEIRDKELNSRLLLAILAKLESTPTAGAGATVPACVSASAAPGSAAWAAKPAMAPYESYPDEDSQEL